MHSGEDRVGLEAVLPDTGADFRARLAESEHFKCCLVVGSEALWIRVSRAA